MRLDDDVILESDYVAKLMQVIEEGYDIASGITPPCANPIMQREVSVLKGEINRVRLGPQGELLEFGDDCGYGYLESVILPAGHFRSCALYKSEINKIQYPDNLSRYGFREESFFSLKARMKGYRIGVHTKAIVWHLQSPSGGGRQNVSQESIQRDDTTFREWVQKKVLSGELK